MRLKKQKIVLTFILLAINLIAYGQTDTTYKVNDFTQGYSFKNNNSEVVTVSKHLHGFVAHGYEFFVEIPEDYKRVAFYVDDEAEPAIILYNVKRGYEPLFLPTDCNTIWAIMDDDIYEKTNIKE